MTISFGGVFADAGGYWRRERKLIVPVAGMFFFVPMLGAVMLLSRVDFPPEATPEQLRQLLMGFYEAHLLPILLINLAVDFGAFALLNLILQGNGRTLGEVLLISLKRFVPFLVIDLLAGMAFGLGASLFLFPGLFLFARGWLAAPAFAAEPGEGIGGAFVRGWRLSRGFAWISLLGVAGAVFLAALFAIVIATALLGALSASLGDALVLPAIAWLVCALIGAAAWAALVLLRVAAYRRLRQGI